MGKSKRFPLIVLAVMLVALIGFVYQTPADRAVEKSHDLREELGQIDGYQTVSTPPVSEDIVRFLDLDDYIQARYQNSDGPVTLYVGYYYGLEKLSAAHSPLVCFPGQGWTLSGRTEKNMQVEENLIHYTEMVGSLDDRQELIIYWYQAGETTAPQIYRNKLNAVWNRVKGGSDEHAFVRVTVPIEQGLQGGRNAAISRAEGFISRFYPVFLRYVDQQVRPVPAS